MYLSFCPVPGSHTRRVSFSSLRVSRPGGGSACAYLQARHTVVGMLVHFAFPELCLSTSSASAYLRKHSLALGNFLGVTDDLEVIFGLLRTGAGG